MADLRMEGVFSQIVLEDAVYQTGIFIVLCSYIVGSIKITIIRFAV